MFLDFCVKFSPTDLLRQQTPFFPFDGCRNPSIKHGYMWDE